MSSPLPAQLVAGITFVGRGGGAVKALRGFSKSHHSVPDAVNAATQAFLARLCGAELTEEAEGWFQATRTALAYKRKDLALTVSGAQATLAAKDFSLEFMYALEEADPARYGTTLTLANLRSLDLARTAEFEGLFAGRFTELVFGLAKGARVESVIDAIEALDGEGGLQVAYPSDCADCTIAVEGVAAQVRCTGVALEILFSRAGSPAELIDAFAAVREAFQISKPLAGILGR
jgi:hypothetical protein